MAQMLEAYNTLILQGKLQEDSAQRQIAERLDGFCAAVWAARASAGQSGFFARLLRRRSALPYAGLKGFYLYGGVGRGKTMLMDLLFASLPAGDKKRVHFNDFMSDAQNRLAALRAAEQAGQIKLPAGGAVLKIADDLAREAHILCFDEFSVTDIADAMLLARLFTALFARGIVLVATSNIAPEDLYHNGLNRDLFQPFLPLLAEKTEICALDGGRDYRQQDSGAEAETGAEAAGFPCLLSPANAAAKARLDALWQQATGQSGGQEAEVALHGRSLAVPCAAKLASGAGEAARFEFRALCGAPLAAADYAALAARFSLFFIDNVPFFSEDNRNEAKRFILLVDTLYDRHLPLCLSAAAPAAELYRGAALITEKFEFARAASRLAEMESQAWIEASPLPFLAQQRQGSICGYKKNPI